jgi:hypothetical protein
MLKKNNSSKLRSFITDYLICGLAPYGDSLVLLTFSEKDADSESGQDVANEKVLYRL